MVAHRSRRRSFAERQNTPPFLKLIARPGFELPTNESGSCSHLHSQSRDPLAIGRVSICLVQPIHIHALKLVFDSQTAVIIAQAFLVGCRCAAWYSCLVVR